MDATGSLTLGDETFDVTGTAWFDHQWGDFIAVGGGGWDWFAINLDDGTDLMLSLDPGRRRVVLARLRDARGRRGPIAQPAARGLRRRGHRSLAEPEDRRRTTPPAGGSRSRARTSTIDADADGRRPRSSTRGRRPASSTGRDRRSSSARRGGKPLGGEAYVELTGYGAGRYRGAVGSGRRGERDAGAAGDVAKLGVDRVQAGEQPDHLLGGGPVGRRRSGSRPTSPSAAVSWIAR